MYIGEFSLYWFFNQFISSFYIHWHFHITTNLVPFTHFINVLICQVINGTIKTLTNNLLLCLKEPELFGPGGMMENPSVVKQMPDEAALKIQLPALVCYREAKGLFLCQKQ